MYPVGQIGVADADLDGVVAVVDVLNTDGHRPVREHDVAGLVQRHRERELFVFILLEGHVLPKCGEFFAYTTKHQKEQSCK